MKRAGTRLALWLDMAEQPASSNVRRERYGNEAGRRVQDRAERWIDDHPTAPLPAGDVDDPRRSDDAVSIDEVIERLSRDMSDAVNRAPMDERDELRTYATELVREDTSSASDTPRLPARRARLSFFAVAVWLAVAGFVLAFLFPPAAIVCFLMAGLAGVLSVMLGPGEPKPERTSEPPQ